MEKINTKSISLTQFLIENPVDDVSREIYLSKRFKEAGHKFKIKAMTGSQFSAYQKEATAIAKKKNINFDTGLFHKKIILNHCIEPNFKDSELVKQAGCITPEQFLDKVLLAGEIVDLADEISALSGFGSDTSEVDEDAKNS
jgi:Phage XkdN-like protein.